MSLYFKNYLPGEIIRTSKLGSHQGDCYLCDFEQMRDIAKDEAYLNN